MPKRALPCAGCPEFVARRSRCPRCNRCFCRDCLPDPGSPCRSCQKKYAPPWNRPDPNRHNVKTFVRGRVLYGTLLRFIGSHKVGDRSGGTWTREPVPSTEIARYRYPRGLRRRRAGAEADLIYHGPGRDDV